MRAHQAFRFELGPRDRACSALASHAGAARFAYSWGLATVISQLEAYRALTELALRQGARAEHAAAWAGEVSGPLTWSLPALRRRWNQEKAEAAPWWAGNSKEAYNSGLDGVSRALKGYFTSRSGQRAGQPLGFPKFKKKGARASRALSATISGQAGRWYVSLRRSSTR